MARRRSFIGPLVLIGLGLLLLYSTLRSNWGLWEVIWRYWPVLLIAWGLGKLFDHWRHRESPAGAPGPRFSGGEVGMAIALAVLVGLAFTHKSEPQPPEPLGGYHFTQTVDRQGAKSVHAEVVLGEGDLHLSGGAAQLFHADCYYSRPFLKPEVSYRLTGADGSLKMGQPSAHRLHIGDENRSDWTLRFTNDVPLDLNIKMGAGTGRLRLSGLQLSHLRVEGGVGTLSVDLGGDWKQSFDGSIKGGVGTVTVRLPATVGVRIHATAGLGRVNAPGFQRDGDAYVNSAYGTSPVTISLDIAGGIGTINLEPASRADKQADASQTLARRSYGATQKRSPA